jgi:hypothetical protein
MPQLSNGTKVTSLHYVLASAVCKDVLQSGGQHFGERVFLARPHSKPTVLIRRNVLIW